MPVSSPPDDLVRRLSARYLFVLLAVIALIAADQAIIQPMFVRASVYAPVINKAGRQRMLSQKLTKAALASQVERRQTDCSFRLAELSQALQEWSAAHRALRKADPAVYRPDMTAPALRAAWADVDHHFAAIESAAASLLANDESTADKSANRASGLTESADRSSAISTMLQHEPAFLTAMERIVKLLEQQSTAELARLRAYALAISGTIVALIAGLGWFVIRPATRAIGSQVDDLEAQVASRTRELDATLSSLRCEIQKRESTEARNQALAAQLAHADRVESLGHLAAGLAHDLNQPLGAIANYAESACVVLAGPMSDRSVAFLSDYATRIQQAALRAGGIVRRIRNFVRPGPNQTAPVNLASLVQEVVELCRPEATRAEIEFAFIPPQVADVPVNVDSIQIQQVLVNLVQNAIQAMEHAPPQRRRLLLALSVAHEAVQVDVADGGPGIASANPETLFTPFHTTKADGLGVGLSICRSIIELHQGTIWARSLPNYGAQFSFILPLAPRHAIEPANQTNGVCG